ncbi:MAG TPA: hypothetical protein VKM56_07270 [Verrucomicrobiae bacterium]|nr:hypothetical protein [Verrucomicrobiae bacterium]
MNKVTLLVIIALAMVGSLVFKAWQRAPVLVLGNPQPKTVAVASASVTNEQFRLRLRQIIGRAKASSQQRSTEKRQISDAPQKTDPDKAVGNP